MPGPPVPVSEVDPFADDLLADPYPMHERLRDAGPVVRLARYDAWALARYADVDRALRDPATFCSRRGVGLADYATDRPWRPPSLLLEADPPEHGVARRVLTSVLSPRAVAAMRATFRAEAERIVDPLVERGRFDAVRDLAAVFPVKVFPDQLGLPLDGREHLLPYGGLVFNGFGPPNAHFQRALERAATAREWIMAHTRREALAPGRLGAQVHERARAAGFDEAEAGLLVRSFLSAGIDTTVHGIGNALLCFAQHPEQWARLHADPSLARAAFEEALRFESSVQMFFRTTTRAVDVDGAAIPAGAKVLILYGSGNRDPRRWERPDRFEIGRRAAGQLAFGAGIHACVGQMMARLEGEIVLETLAARISSLALDGAPVRQLNNTLRGLSSMPVRIEGA